MNTSLSDSVIDAFIKPANLTISELLGDSGLSADQLSEVERWFTAHLIACTRTLQPKSEGVLDATITYQGRTDMGLDSTFYGQQCKLLDTTGTLAAKLGRRSATIFAIPSFEDE